MDPLGKSKVSGHFLDLPIFAEMSNIITWHIEQGLPPSYFGPLAMRQLEVPGPAANQY